ncbi:MAG: glycosyltransferase family 4 protein [Acidobacteriota bacterium]
MRIAYLSAGAAGMYCGACLHDNTLAAVLQAMGHETALIPTYTPMRTDETDVSLDRVFFGALNIYLQQKLVLFRRLPRLVNRLLDHPGLLGWVARFSSTEGRDLGGLTLSMLRGEEGNQRRELERLVDWLERSFQPDVMHLSNSLFVGLVPALKRVLGIPVICSVQGEDAFLDDLPAACRGKIVKEMRRHAPNVDAFVANSRYYAGYMASLLEIPAGRMHRIHLGLKLDGHGGGRSSGGPAPFTVGYMARICPDKGLHLLVEAFRGLAVECGRDAVRLRVAGYLGARDRAYFHRLVQRIRSWGLEGSFEYLGEVDRQEKIAFLGGLDVLSVPTTYREPKGLFVLEALANGTPVVQPAHGAFPELLDLTGGGILCEPGSAASLQRALRDLQSDPALRRELGRRGRESVHRRFSDRRMGEQTLELYRTVLA